MKKINKLKINWFLVRIILAIELLIASNFTEIGIIMIIIGYIVSSYDLYIENIKQLIKGNIFHETTLMILASLGAIIIGEATEALIVIILYQIGEKLSNLMINNSKKSIIDLLNLKVEKAHLVTKTTIKDIKTEKLQIGDIIIVKPGEKIPVDGVLVEGSTNIDMKSLTGESIPKVFNINDEVLSGSINLSSPIAIKVTNKYKDSTASKIMDLIENATKTKSNSEKSITRFSKIYTPIVLIIALIIVIIPYLMYETINIENLRMGLIFLVASCPCALVISIPLGYYIGLGKLSKEGIIFKGSNEIEKMKNVSAIAFDKTGTLTKGNFNITSIVTNNEKELFYYLNYAEYYSNHPIANVIKNYNTCKVNEKLIKNYKEIQGNGIQLIVDKKQVLVGNGQLMIDNGIQIEKTKEIGTIIYVSVDKELLGHIVIEDEIKVSIKDFISNLKKKGIKDLIILSGDDKNIVEQVSKKIGINKYYSNLLPAKKLEYLNKIQEETEGYVIFIGDGVNDAPVLIKSDIGISMGTMGSDAAIEASDVIILNDDITKVIDAIEISKLTNKIVWRNIIFAISVKMAILLLTVLKLSNMSLAVFADVGVTIIAIMNTFKILKYKGGK